MGAWGRRPQRVEGGALAFLTLLTALQRVRGRGGWPVGRRWCDAEVRRTLRLLTGRIAVWVTANYRFASRASFLDACEQAGWRQAPGHEPVNGTG